MSLTKLEEARGALVPQVFKKILLTFLSFISIPAFCFAQNNSVDMIEKYMNSIKYFEASFIQDDKPNSQLSEGIFYLARPGKLRVDYLNPFEVSLYTDNRTTIYYDKELDEASSIRTVSTPLHFLLRKNISFNDQSFKITNIEENKDETMISFQERGKESQGTLTLKFQKNPLELISIKLINGVDQEIEMTFFNIKKNIIKDSTFVFKKKKRVSER